jgi:hypothetical protein
MPTRPSSSLLRPRVAKRYPQLSSEEIRRLSIENMMGMLNMMIPVNDTIKGPQPKKSNISKERVMSPIQEVRSPFGGIILAQEKVTDGKLKRDIRKMYTKQDNENTISCVAVRRTLEAKYGISLSNKKTLIKTVLTQCLADYDKKNLKNSKVFDDKQKTKTAFTRKLEDRGFTKVAIEKFIKQLDAPVHAKSDKGVYKNVISTASQYDKRAKSILKRAKPVLKKYRKDIFASLKQNRKKFERIIHPHEEKRIYKASLNTTIPMAFYTTKMKGIRKRKLENEKNQREPSNLLARYFMREYKTGYQGENTRMPLQPQQRYDTPSPMSRAIVKIKKGKRSVSIV